MSDVYWEYVLTALRWGGAAGGFGAALILGFRDIRRGMKYLDAIFAGSYLVQAAIHGFALHDAANAVACLITGLFFAVFWWFSGGKDDWRKKKRKLLDAAKVIIRGNRLAVATPAGGFT